MDIKTKLKKLKEIYDDFEIQARPFKDSAVCKVGCAFCCIHFGNVDAITMEGLIIHEWIETLDKPDQINIRKKISKNMKKREKRSITPCPFLKKDNTCRIYTMRPFSCRQLYSLRKCTHSGPMVHRQAVELAKKTVKKLQQLDATGYSGHISYILHLIAKPDFRELYKSGGFDPVKIMPFGKKYGIIINRMVSSSSMKIMQATSLPSNITEK
ncbi:MAG: YkgJ family cysteine cluster protein [Deltaproteobacteria bacterium]|nr:YkgJ family cysteine cluster protein [Deltaproteobacteria bacterium]MBW2089157.1 YkgJ family cysteine cluster protein [Deltaproteobacteria bacterium]MBW2321815.1 YkgJ family cysteine cluster protein [Deltaproteobacteria bacterium]OQY12507.1 MAG: hypothetical protein B6I30_04720 [Desulfobacteraceae bacterium 4572_187]